MKWAIRQITEGQRKFTFAWAVLIICFIALLFDKLEDSSFADIIIWIGGFYMGGNVGEHFSKAWKDRAGKITTPPT